MSTANKRLQRQGREIVAKVFHRMEHEAANGVEKANDPTWRTAQAVGLSESTITKILKEANRASTSTDVSKRKRCRPNVILNNFDTATLRQTIMSFPTDYKELPTLRKLKEVLYEKNCFDGTADTLRTTLKGLGYEWMNTESSKALVEKHDIQILRFKYLRQLQRYRDEGRCIIFTVETGIDTKHIGNKSSKRVKTITTASKSPPKNTRVILAHAGGIDGFIPQAFSMYECNSRNLDYHEDISRHKYKLWITMELLPNLPQNAVVVLGNAHYNTVMTVETPTSSSTKSDMQTWLTQKNIPFVETMKKIELYDLIAKNKDKFKSFIIDELIRSNGFEVLRLPPYHPELNPMEKVWEILKENLRDNEFGDYLTYIKTLMDERFKMIDSTKWATIFNDAEELEKQYLRYFDMENEFIINANDSDTDVSDMILSTE